MAKALIVFATRTGQTRQIAELIAEGIRFSGHTAEVVDVKSIKSESDLEGFDAYVFGSSTYHGEMLQAMKTFLFIAEKADLEGKPGGAFGSFGWSGEGAEEAAKVLEEMQVEAVTPPVGANFHPEPADLQKCYDLGLATAARLTEAQSA